MPPQSTSLLSQQPTSQTLPAGRLVGDYKIESLLGSGGMADVYYAIDLQLDRPVALKILRPKLAEDETYLQRFSQEAKAAAALVHPNIVQIYSVGQSGKLRYIAQEFVPGTDLRTYLTYQTSSETDAPPADADRQALSAKLDISAVLSILLQVLAALSKSSSVGIVHRDIKPENIMLTHEGEVKVADFGLARWAAGDDPRLTSTGITLGTPLYMSPEQIQGGEVDVRSDLYSLGVTLFHMLYGKPPFQGDTPLALAMQHVNAKLPDTSSLRQTVPPSLVCLVERLLSKSPEDRIESPEAVAQYLQNHRHSDLENYWPERNVPLPGVVQVSQIPSRATQKLQALLQDRPKLANLRNWSFLALAATWLVGVFYFGATTMARRMPAAIQMLKVDDNGIYEGIPRLADAKAQYEWALLDRSASRITKWEAVERYFPSNASSLNRMYGGLAQLQLARLYQESGDIDSATKQLAAITGDSQMLPLVQAYAWLQQATIEHGRGDKNAIQSAVYQALRLRETLSKNRKDIEQLDRAIRAMPPDIELYWSPDSTE